MSILSSLANIFKIEELKNRVLFTIGIICIIRLGAHVPTPGVDGAALSRFILEQTSRAGGGLLRFMDMFSGGALKKCTLFALGIMPYISATIILQLLTAVLPVLEKLQREGEAGQKKIREWGRYGTFFLSGFQALFIARYLSNPANFGGVAIVPNPGLLFTITTVLSLTAGTILLMWLGEQITDRGIGNGISIIITINILSAFPNALLTTYQIFSNTESGGFLPFKFILMAAMFVAVIVAVVMITQGERKIPVQYAKRVVGRRYAAGHSTFIPLRVNFSGVMPIIFASSLLFFPATIAQFTDWGWLKQMASFMTPPSLPYYFFYVFMIIFFSFFWTATVFNPIQIAEDLRRNSGFIPGIRPGKTTSEFLDKTMTRVTLSGAIFLAGIAIFPDILASGKGLNLPMQISGFFGGTSLLIIVGVMLDTMRQIETHLVSRHYESFMKTGRIKGRRRSYG